ncbi:OLC1v1030376C1 [Oldenlandia corymbosa var. corymbosa]|uniref:OLC1v1030376C1 n=2 Tax=Oldenlandia corymbosa var. corymbosa TaxID=529605 RepID=A0AAV1CGY6_OLDCO|nr:OLC1v1030376C1 [Oldenlandia corymbosa var. corymbosa]
MKFMKLGSKPDAFQVEGNCIRHVSAELLTDVIIVIEEIRFYLHKFPLLSKSDLLQKLVSKASEENADEIELSNFPGGPKAFEICAKFCYGITVTLNPYNVVAARCAAEYLGMTEDIDRGNLTFKIEVFLNTSVFRSWKDSIIVLQTTKSLLPWSEDLKIVGRCIDSIASKTSVDPSNITWSYTYAHKPATKERIFEEGVKGPCSVPKDWWIEDVCELEVDLYKRVMLAIKAKGRMEGKVIGEALRTYAMRWLPDSISDLVSEVHNKRNRSLVETMICLLPSSAGCSCSFLLKLLKIAILVEADDALRENLIDNISFKLDEAAVTDLLIPARSPQTTIYDVALVKGLVNRFATRAKNNQKFSVYEKSDSGVPDFVLAPANWLNTTRLVDDFLKEIAPDPNLTLLSFIELVQMVPETARPIHDGLYRAIDMYLKGHPTLTKAERKNLCGLMDVQKLTPDASMHAAQNDRLPLRVVVQVLYFEQLKSTARVNAMNTPKNDASETTMITTKTEERDRIPPKIRKSLSVRMDQMRIKDGNLPSTTQQLDRKGSKRVGTGVPQLLPSRSRRIFDKLWGVGKLLNGNVENRSSDTSGSSQSPRSIIQGETKSSVSYARHRRHSIS